MVKPVAAVAAVAVALLAAGSAQPRTHAAAAPLGLVSDETGAYLVRLDARTLRPAPGRRVLLGPMTGAWGFSPDRTMVAVGVEGEASGDCADPPASLRFVEVATLDVSADLSLGGGFIEATAWLSPERLIAMVSHCGASSELLTVDPGTGHVLARRIFSGYPRSVRQAGARLVLLASSRDRIEAATLTVVGADGEERRIALDRIEAGFERLDPASGPGRYVWPALAVTPDGDRAYVVSTTGLIGAVELSSLAVTYNAGLTAQAPRAAAKGRLEGASRVAKVLPTGMLAVAGADDRSYVDSAGREHIQHIRSGLAFVDTTTWATQMIDRAVDNFLLTGRTLLATGAAAHPLYSSTGPPNAEPLTGSGLTAYSLAGGPRFHRFGKKEVGVIEAYGRRSFLFVPPLLPLKMVDLQTGKVLGTRALGAVPQILQGSSSTG